MSFLHMDMTQVVEILPHLFYIANTMSADVLATQGARTSSTMIIIQLTRINSVPHVYGLINLLHIYRK